MTTTHHDVPPTPEGEALAHREVQLRILIERGGLDVTDLNVAAALLSIAIDAFHDHPPEAVQLLVGAMHQAVREKDEHTYDPLAFQQAVQRAFAPRRPGQNVCCEHVARGQAEVHGETALEYDDDFGPVRVLARLCEPCSKLDYPTPVVPLG